MSEDEGKPSLIPRLLVSHPAPTPELDLNPIFCSMQDEPNQSLIPRPQVASRTRELELNQLFCKMTEDVSSQSLIPRPPVHTVRKSPDKISTTPLSRIPLTSCRMRKTYENLYYRKKAFLESESALSTFSSLTGSPVPGHSYHSQESHAAYVRKTFTKTVTEYDEFEEKKETEGVTGNTRPNPPKQDASGNKNTKKNVVQKRRAGNRDNPSQNESSVSPSPIPLRSKVPVPDSKSKPTSTANHSYLTTRRSCRDETRRSAKESLIPKRVAQKTIVLPGHGDPHLETPKVLDPCEESLWEDDEDTHVERRGVAKEKPKVCSSCKRVKKLLHQSEATVRYLTEQLIVKDSEIADLKKCVNAFKKLQKVKKTGSNCLQTRDCHCRDASTNTISKSRITSDDDTPTNPLVANEQLVNGQAESDPVPSRDTSSLAQYSIPKFDLDEFMRQYFRQSILMNIGNDFIHNNVNEPFDPVQLFRASIAARDCMAKAVSQKLKYGYHVLKTRFDELGAVESSEDLKDFHKEYYVLNSYRRFVRYIYYYLKESLKDVETFEQTYIPQHISKENSTKLKYSHETTMKVDKVLYSGVFIPIEEIVQDNG